MRDMHYHSRHGDQIQIALETTEHGGITADIPDYAPQLVDALSALEVGVHCRTVDERSQPRFPLPWRNRGVDIVQALGCELPRTRRKRIVMVHDLAFVTHPEYVASQQTKLGLRALPATVRAADRIITLTKYTRRMLLRCVPDLDPARVVVIPPGISAPEQRPDEMALAEVADKFTLTEPFILAMGTLEPRQNYVRLLEAFAMAQQQSGGAQRLVILGERGWQSASILAASDRAGLADHVICIANASEALREALCSQATVVADVAITTGFSPAVWAAVRQGVPLVVSDGGALPELAGDAALIVPVNDVHALAHALHRACKDEGLRHHLRVRGLARAGQFTWQATAQATFHLYEELLGRVQNADEIAA